VIGIDRIPERLELARRHSAAIALNYENVHIAEELREITGGRAPMLASMR